MLNILSAIKLAKAVSSQVYDNGLQATAAMSAAHETSNAILVSDPKAGTKQVPAEDAHHIPVEKIEHAAVKNLTAILSEELKGAGYDFTAIKKMIDNIKHASDTPSAFMLDALDRLSKGQKVLASVVNTAAVSMESGNNVHVNSGNYVRLMGSLLWRAQSAMRLEAPTIVDNSYVRVLYAHTMLQEADVLIHRAQNLLSSVKDEYGVSAESITFVSKKKTHVSADTIETVAGTSVKIHSDGSVEIVSAGDITISGGTVNVNPTNIPTRKSVLTDASQPVQRGYTKKPIELPQWEGMSPIPTYITTDSELDISGGPLNG